MFNNERKVSDLTSLLGAGGGMGLGALAASLTNVNPIFGAVLGAPLGAIGGSKLGEWYAKNNLKPQRKIRLYTKDADGNIDYVSPQPIVEKSIFSDLNSDNYEYVYTPAIHQL